MGRGATGVLLKVAQRDGAEGCLGWGSGWCRGISLAIFLCSKYLVLYCLIHYYGVSFVGRFVLFWSVLYWRFHFSLIELASYRPSG